MSKELIGSAFETDAAHEIGDVYLINNEMYKLVQSPSPGNCQKCCFAAWCCHTSICVHITRSRNKSDFIFEPVIE